MKCVILLAILGFALVAARVVPRAKHGVTNVRTYSAHPARSAPLTATVRQRRHPVRRTMLVRGYYGANRRSGLAFAAGDDVAGSVLGAPCANCPLSQNVNEETDDAAFDLPLADEPVDDATSFAIAGQQEEVVLPEGIESDIPEETTAIKPQPPKRKVKQEVPADDDDDDDDVPAVKGKKGYPSYNTYFPMSFSGFPGGFRSGEPGTHPGVATAIANSFSMGKGGAATSHAVAYGSPQNPTFKKRTADES